MPQLRKSEIEYYAMLSKTGVIITLETILNWAQHVESIFVLLFSVSQILEIRISYVLCLLKEQKPNNELLIL